MLLLPFSLAPPSLNLIALFIAHYSYLFMATKIQLKYDS